MCSKENSVIIMESQQAQQFAKISPATPAPVATPELCDTLVNMGTCWKNQCHMYAGPQRPINQEAMHGRNRPAPRPRIQRR